MENFSNKQGTLIVHNLIITIQDNKQYLSDIDGAIGDGDHGINMNKGFTLCGEELQKNPGDLSYSFGVLSKILMLRIGGSMGPLYGKFFKAMAQQCEGQEVIDAAIFGKMLQASLEAIQSISPAKPGDKTLMDTLVPAVNAYTDNLNAGGSFAQALEAMKGAARTGRDSTKEMVAKLGRSSRLGERSKGVLDAGATSCYLILETMANSTLILIEN